MSSYQMPRYSKFRLQRTMTVIDFGSEVGMLIVSLHAERNVIKNV